MRSLKKICAAVVLTCAFALSVLADNGACGEISCPRTATPQATVTGEIECDVLQLAMSFIQAVLSLS